MALENKVYKIVTHIKPPFIMYEPEINLWTGLFIDVLVRIANITGLRYTLYHVADNRYGFYNKTSHEWNGMIQDILTKKADIAFGGLTVRRDRAEVVDFTSPFYDDVGLSVLLKRKKMNTQIWGWIFNFSTQAWIYLLIAYCVSSILIWIFDTWSPYSFRNQQMAYINDPESSKRFFTLKESLWFCFASITPQGGGEVPKHFSARFTSSAWWLFGFIIVATYTANMAAQLTLARLDKTIESYPDLIRQLRVHFGAVSNSTAAFFFENLKLTEELYYNFWKDLTLDTTLSTWDKAQLAVWEYPIAEKYIKIWKHMINGPLPQTFEDGVNRVRFTANGTPFALVAENNDALYQTMLHCELRMLPDIIAQKSYGIAVPKGSPLRQILNKAIYNFTDTDFIERLKEKWWTHNQNKQVCTHLDSETASLLIQNFNGMFVTIAIGIAVSYFVLILELHYKIWMEEALSSVKHFLMKIFCINQFLQITGLIKLQRPCKLAQTDVEPLKDKPEDKFEDNLKRFG